MLLQDSICHLMQVRKVTVCVLYWLICLYCTVAVYVWVFDFHCLLCSIYARETNPAVGHPQWRRGGDGIMLVGEPTFRYQIQLGPTHTTLVSLCRRWKCENVQFYSSHCFGRFECPMFLIQRSQESEEQSPVTDCFSHDPRVDLSHSSNCSNYDGTFEEGQLAPPSECCLLDACQLTVSATPLPSCRQPSWRCP